MDNIRLIWLKLNIIFYSIISFDIFDTLLVRPYAKPTDLFKHMETLFKVDNFAKLRIEAELNARKKFSNQEDVTLLQIYEQLDTKYRFLMDKEIELETKTLFPNKKVVDIYNFCKRMGKKIIITSDMYLPKNVLENILLKNGIDGWSNFYLSNDIMKTKCSSSLYQYISNELKVNGKCILHIGDNKEIDYINAKKQKWGAFWIPKVIDCYLKKERKLKKFYNSNSDSLTASIITAISAHCLSKSKNYYYKIGFKYAAPIIYGFVHWIIKQSINNNINKLLFVARDGFSLNKVFEKINKTSINGYYIYAPRYLNVICNVDYIARYNYSQLEALPAIKNILNFYRNKNEYLMKNTPQQYTCEDAHKFIQKNIDIYNELAEKERQKYKNYLFNIINDDKDNIAIVDSIAMFFSAQTLISSVLQKDVTAFYWTIDERTQLKNKFQKIFSFKNNSNAFIRDWNIMEYFMTAPEQPIKTINNGVVVYKKPTKYENFKIYTYKLIFEGIMDFVQILTDIFDCYDVDFDYEILVQLLNIYLTNPNKQDIKYMKKIKHAWDLGHDNYVPIIHDWYMHYRTKYIFLNTFKFLTKMNYGDQIQYKLFGILPLLTIKQKEAL